MYLNQHTVYHMRYKQAPWLTGRCCCGLIPFWGHWPIATLHVMFLSLLCCLKQKWNLKKTRKQYVICPPPLYGVCRLKSRCPYATCPAQLLTSECDFHPWGKDHCLVYNTLSHEGEQMCLGISKSFHEGKSYDPNKSYFIWNSPSSDLGLVRDMWSH